MSERYRCPVCGNEQGLYVRSDTRWDPDLGEWRVVWEGMEDLVDCTECDHLGPMASFECDDDDDGPLNMSGGDCPEQLEHTNKGT